MGNMKSVFQRLITGRSRYRILMVGLDSAGKSTVLYKLRRYGTAKTIPTIGLNVEEVQIGDSDLKIYDIGGQTQLRELWSHYMNVNSSAVVFIIDSTDHERINEAKEELHKLLRYQETAKSPVLILANKQDLPNALNRVQVAKALHASALSQIRPCAVFEVTAITGDGLEDAMKWLTDSLMKKIELV